MTERAKDHDEIARVMQLYVGGFNDNDLEKFREAFHEDAWIFYVSADGKLTKNLISRVLSSGDAPSWDVVGRIVSVTQVEMSPQSILSGTIAQNQIRYGTTSTI